MKRHAFLLLVPCLLSACATVSHGPRQKLAIDSVPGGAAVFIDGRPKGSTPLAVSLARVTPHQVRVELAGYRPLETRLVSQAWKDMQEHPSDALAALVPINTPSVIIDTLTTSAWELDAAATADVERLAGQEKLAYGELTGLRFHVQKSKPPARARGAKHARASRPQPMARTSS